MPARFTVRLTPSFTRDLERLPLSIQDKILEAIKRLEATPFGPPLTAMDMDEKARRYYDRHRR